MKQNSVQSQPKNAQCSCGHVNFTVKGKPLVRGYCHCTICQEFNQAHYADVCIFRARDIEMPKAQEVEFRAYTSPAIVHRGKCVKCHGPAVEFVSLPFMPKLVIVPSGNIDSTVVLPDASFHIFYRSRVNDMVDNVSKFNGYMSSQIALLKGLIKGFSA